MEQKIINWIWKETSIVHDYWNIFYLTIHNQEYRSVPHASSVHSGTLVDAIHVINEDSINRRRKMLTMLFRHIIFWQGIGTYLFILYFTCTNTFITRKFRSNLTTCMPSICIYYTKVLHQFFKFAGSIFSDGRLSVDSKGAQSAHFGITKNGYLHFG